MIIIDAQNDVASFLENMKFDLMGLVRLDQVTFELSQSVIDELTIVHVDVLKSLEPSALAKLEEVSVLMIFNPHKTECLITDNTVDVIQPDISKSLFENKVSLLSDLVKEKQVLRSQLITINSELSETLGSVEVELLKIKKIYEKKAPKRFNDVKGIQVYSKYTAGENVGGEFFDLHVDQNFALVVMSSTSSYLASSMILKLFADLKKDKNITHEVMENLISDIKSNIIELNSTKKKQIDIHLFVGIVDLNKHSISGYRYGDFNIMSSAVVQSLKPSISLLEGTKEEASFNKEFQREERILLCSPGFIKNWKKLNPDFIMEELMLNKSIKPIDILDEAFFQLKKDTKSNFLAYDASAILMEVKKNAMVQV
jgi:hypothetical protein